MNIYRIDEPLDPYELPPRCPVHGVRCGWVRDECDACWFALDEYSRQWDADDEADSRHDRETDA